MTTDINSKINNINTNILSENITEAEKEALDLYSENKESIILLNMLGNIYNKKGDSKEAIKYLEEANKLSQGKDGHILFNLGVSYSFTDKDKAIKYLEEARILLPDDENLDNFIKTF